MYSSFCYTGPVQDYMYRARGTRHLPLAPHHTLSPAGPRPLAMHVGDVHGRLYDPRSPCTTKDLCSHAFFGSPFHPVIAGIRDRWRRQPPPSTNIPLYLGLLHHYPPLFGLWSLKHVRACRTFADPARPPTRRFVFSTRSPFEPFIKASRCLCPTYQRAHLVCRP